MAIFSLFAWAFVTLISLNQNTINAITLLDDKVNGFFGQERSVISLIFVFSAILFGLVSIKICRLNGRVAMQEIYLTDETSEQIIEIKLLLAVTLFAIAMFLPRLAGLWY